MLLLLTRRRSKSVIELGSVESMPEEKGEEEEKAKEGDDLLCN